ncbi:MAG: hypothetical protein KGZ94_00770 [Clostridia bacterium]|nr:hypothetical protein [Clostridia bacterium]
MEANSKLAVANLIDSQVVVLDAPNKTRFDEYILPPIKQEYRKMCRNKMKSISLA